MHRRRRRLMRRKRLRLRVYTGRVRSSVCLTGFEWSYGTKSRGDLLVRSTYLFVRLWCQRVLACAAGIPASCTTGCTARCAVCCATGCPASSQASCSARFCSELRSSRWEAQLATTRGLQVCSGSTTRDVQFSTERCLSFLDQLSTAAYAAAFSA